MSIKQDSKPYYAVCDRCGASIELQDPAGVRVPDFYELVIAIVDAGWNSYKRGGEWFNTCAKCLSKRRRD